MSAVGTRLGVLGGTFDPMHAGHLDAADAARSALDLDEVLVIPAGKPPHRSGEPHASRFHRFALVALAIAGRDGWRVSDMELLRAGPSYTSLTLRDLQAHGRHPLQLFFITGADAFAEIATWHDYPAILDACHFAVVARPGMTPEAAVSRNPSLRARVRSVAEASRDLTETAIFPVTARTSAVSSSEIRARLADGRSIDGMVPAPVAQYIHTHHLYKAVDDLHGKD